MTNTTGAGIGAFFARVVKIEPKVRHVVAEIPSPMVLVVEHGFGGVREHRERAALGAKTAGPERGGDALGEAVVVGEVARDEYFPKRRRIAAAFHGAIKMRAADGEQRQADETKQGQAAKKRGVHGAE